jgi:hypothetical protein
VPDTRLHLQRPGNIASLTARALTAAALAIVLLPVSLASGGERGATGLRPQPPLQVICATEYGEPGAGAYRTRPHECMFHKRFEPVAYAYMVIMRGIHWTHWGQRVAVGRGKFLANMAGPTPGKVRLTHPLEVCGHRVFTLAHFKFQGLPSSGQGLQLDRQLNGC